MTGARNFLTSALPLSRPPALPVRHFLNPKSAEALAGFAGIVGFFGLVALEPSAQFFMLAAAAVIALIPVIFARSKRLRIVAAVISLLAIARAVATYPDHIKNMERYQKRAQERAAKAKAALPPPAQEKK